MTEKYDVQVIQRPRDASTFDLGALEELGDVTYVMPASPNIHDKERLSNDVRAMVGAIERAGPNTVFISLGASPMSNTVFGAALAIADRPVKVGLYSRNRDRDGRRNVGGSYRIVDLINLKEAYNGEG